jgi:hypothetical protein
MIGWVSWSCSVLLLLSTSTWTQTNEKEKAQKEAERKQELKRKSLVLLDEVAAAALSLKLPENRSFVLATAADLLWDYDEKRARNLFWDALNTLNLMMTSASIDGTGKLSAKEKAQSQSSYFSIFAIRQELLRKVAQRDPQLALDLLRATRQPPVDQINTGYRMPDERDLEQEIAAEAVARDPKRALQLAREGLAKGFTYKLLDLLYRLNQKDTELGTKFAGEIIDKLQTQNIATDLFGSRIAIELLVTSRTRKKFIGDKSLAAPGSPRPKSLELDNGQRRRLVEMIANAALGGSPNSNLLFAISEIMPEFEEFVPERVALLQRKLATFTQTLNKEQKISVEYDELFRNGTPEEMLALSFRSDGNSAWIQQEAIVRAVLSRKADSMREFINSQVDDEARRKSLLDALDSEQISGAIYRGDTEELRKLLPLVRLKEERARAMAEMAILLEGKGNHDEAAKLLDEAQALIKSDLRSPTQTNAPLALVAAYALVDPSKAFAILERTIDNANDEISKALLLDKILKSGIVKKGEIMLQQSGVIPMDFAMFRYGKGVTALATADFSRTKAVADRLQRNELRIMARLLLAQALLRGNAQPTNEEQ